MEQAESSSVYLLAADAVLLLHVLFVAFVIGGLALILAGKARRWLWIRNPWFRLAHLLAIAVVVVQSWFGAICPLTTIEMTLRSRAGDSSYPGSFVAHWLETLLYYQRAGMGFCGLLHALRNRRRRKLGLGPPAPFQAYAVNGASHELPQSRPSRHR